MLLALFFHFHQPLYKRYHRSPANSIRRRSYLSITRLSDSVAYPFLVYILQCSRRTPLILTHSLHFTRRVGKGGIMGISSIGTCLVSNLYPTDTRLASLTCFESPDRQISTVARQSTVATSGFRDNTCTCVTVLPLLLVHWTLIPVSQHYAIVTLLNMNITFQLLSTFYSFHVSLLLYHITSWRRLLQLIFLGAPPCP